MNAGFLEGDDGPWADAVGIVAAVPGLPAPAPVIARVGICANDGSFLRLDILANAGHSPFKDVRCAGSVVFVGFGAYLFVVVPATCRVEAIALEGYFGHLYTPEDLDASPQGFVLLVSSASELLSLSCEGGVNWRAHGLGADGVLVHRVEDGKIHGSGEWDPPGGWVPFQLDIDTGRTVAD